jgi:hypothetical protein
MEAAVVLRSEGQYRTVPTGNHAPMVYVRGSSGPSYVTEAVYRAKGYKPVFESLPTEDQYDAQWR